jgi:hypothetical protein
MPHDKCNKTKNYMDMKQKIYKRVDKKKNYYNKKKIKRFNSYTMTINSELIFIFIRWFAIWQWNMHLYESKPFFVHDMYIKTIHFYIDIQ